MENPEKQERKPQVTFPGTDELSAALKEIKEKTGLKVSEIGRPALWDKIAEIRANHPAYESERRAAIVTESV